MNVQGIPQGNHVGWAAARPGERQDRSTGGRRRARDAGRNQGPVHRRLREDAEGRSRLLPAVGPLPGKELRRRQDPRRLLQARGASVGEGDPHLAPDRPADPAAVRQGLPQRDADHLHRAEPRPGERSGHRGADRLVGGADAVGRAVPRSGRRLPRRLHQRRIRAEPAARRDGVERSRPGRRRHPRRRADGRIRGQGAFARR